MQSKEILDVLDKLDRALARKILNEEEMPYGVMDERGDIYGFEYMEGLSKEDADILNDWGCIFWQLTHRLKEEITNPKPELESRILSTEDLFE